MYAITEWLILPVLSLILAGWARSFLSGLQFPTHPKGDDVH